MIRLSVEHETTGDGEGVYAVKVERAAFENVDGGVFCGRQFYGPDMLAQTREGACRRAYESFEVALQALRQTGLRIDTTGPNALDALMAIRKEESNV